MERGELVIQPIGVVRTPFSERSEAPRQGTVGRAEGTVELHPGRGFEHALEDLAAWEVIWLVTWFDRNEGWRPKVLPPRSDKRRGVFATRSPHRPNPIGLSAVELLEVRGLMLRVRGVDMLDGTPVLDIKPYVAYADAFPDARAGWLERTDPGPGFVVAFEPRAAEQLAWLVANGVALRDPIVRALSLGPEPHPYRRIKREARGMRLALKEWRAWFRAEGLAITVERIASGYKPAELARAAPAVHRSFVERFEH